MRQPKPITVRGVRYGSCTAAAAALGVTRSAVSHAMKRGTLDRLGSGENKHYFATRVRGVVYPTQKAAAEALGVTPSAVNQAIRRGRENFIGTRRKTPIVRSPSAVVRGLFEAIGAGRITIRDVAAALDITPEAVSYWKSGRTAPSILTVEEVADVLGYELVLRKKGGT